MVKTASPEMLDFAPKDLPLKTGPSYAHISLLSWYGCRMRTLMVKVALSWEIGVALVLGGVGCTRGVLPSTVAKGRAWFLSVNGRLMLDASAEAAGLVIRDNIV